MLGTTHRLEGLRTVLAATGAVVTHDPLPVVSGDGAQLRTLCQNLIANAVKFRSERPPRVHVTSERGPAGWTFAVRDDGIGIQPRYQERIFAVFQRRHTRAEYPHENRATGRDPAGRGQPRRRAADPRGAPGRQGRQHAPRRRERPGGPRVPQASGPVRRRSPARRSIGVLQAAEDILKADRLLLPTPFTSAELAGRVREALAG